MVYLGILLAAITLLYLLYRYVFSIYLELYDYKIIRADHNQHTTLAQVEEKLSESSKLQDNGCRNTQFLGETVKSESQKVELEMEAAQTTPKATPLKSADDALIPSFTLSNGDISKKQNTLPSDAESSSKHQVISGSNLNHPEPLVIQDHTQARPQARSTSRIGSTPSKSSSVLPPSQSSLPSSNFRIPSATSSLRPPPSVASTLRAPPSRSLAPSSSLALSSSTLSPNSRPSRKVLLEPGHSPLDWAHLTANPPTPTYLRGASVPQRLLRVPPSMLRYHNGRKGRDAWGVWQGKVYNMTPYMKFHPGGEDQLRRGAGKEKEGEKLFMETHPWVSWDAMLGECLIGILVSEEQEMDEDGKATSDLEAMD